MHILNTSTDLLVLPLGRKIDVLKITDNRLWMIEVLALSSYKLYIDRHCMCEGGHPWYSGSVLNCWLTG